MYEDILNLSEKEKAIFYLDYEIKRFYKTFAFLGVVIAFLVLFGGTPDYTVFVTPVTGYLLAYIDIKLTLYFWLIPDYGAKGKDMV